MRIVTNTIKSSPFSKQAVAVADTILGVRRPFKNEVLTKSDYLNLRERIANQSLSFIQKDEELPLVLIGFSLKSPSPLKTLSPYADRAEFEALKHLSSITEKIRGIYDVGAAFKIYADGRIFVDTIIGATDDRVTKYLQGLRGILARLNSKNVDIIAPEDFYRTTVQNSRKQLFEDFPVSKDEILSELENDIFLKEYKTFMRDFYAKDIRAQKPELSIRQSRRIGEDVALGVICAAESLGRYVKSVFGDKMIRLSVHAKPINDIYNKVGIYLNSLNSNCPLPWHGVAVRIPQRDGTEKFIYEKKQILDSIGARLCTDSDGNGAYYELPDSFNYKPQLSFKENILNNIKK